ncbi:MAG: hypothetical protein ABI910_03230 [Gemmatimonadota bacterium]
MSTAPEGGVGAERAAPRARIVAALLTVLLVCARFAERSPLISWRGEVPSPGLSLERSGLRLLLSPVASLFEQWSLLTIPEHVAVFGTVLLIAGSIRSYRSRRCATSWHDRIAAGVVGGARAVIVTVAIALAGALVPWPMSSLHHDDPDVVAVDFHSHTNQSHDGRWDFDVAANRQWHREGGFDVAYITDHADSAHASVMPPADGALPVVLTGAEFRSGGAHVVRLGQPNDRESVLLLTTPFAVGAPKLLLASQTRIVGVEVADASPRGLQCLRETPGQLRDATQLLHAVPIASSNLHGWGRTVAAWTLLRLPGWRRDSPTRLDARIRALLRSANPAATTIVLRRAVHTSTRDRAFILPLMLWTTMQLLDDDEVWIWLAWIWIPTLAPLAQRALSRVGRKAGRTRVAVPSEAPAMADARAAVSL